MIASHHVDGPKTAQEGPKTAPRRPKMVPRRPQDGPKMAPGGPKTAQDGPRRPHDSPRRPQDGPRRPQDGPREAQGVPKACPRRSKGGPKGAQGSPREPKGVPRGTQGCPEGAQVAQNAVGVIKIEGFMGGPMGGPMGTQREPKGAQKAPKGFQKGPKKLGDYRPGVSKGSGRGQGTVRGRLSGARWLPGGKGGTNKRTVTEDLPRPGQSPGEFLFRVSFIQTLRAFRRTQLRCLDVQTDRSKVHVSCIFVQRFLRGK